MLRGAAPFSGPIISARTLISTWRMQLNRRVHLWAGGASDPPPGDLGIIRTQAARLDDLLGWERRRGDIPVTSRHPSVSRVQGACLVRNDAERSRARVEKLNRPNFAPCVSMSASSRSTPPNRLERAMTGRNRPKRCVGSWFSVRLALSPPAPRYNSDPWLDTKGPLQARSSSSSQDH